jgi:hypothetical protein
MKNNLYKWEVVIVLLVLSLIGFALIGCSHTGLKPSDWDHTAQSKVALKDGSFWKPCDDLVALGKLPEAAAQRNLSIDEVISGVDSWYNDYKTKLLTNKAVLDTFFDASQAIAATLGTYFTDANLVRRLALGSAMASSSKLAFDKDFLQNNGMILLIEKAEQLRKDKYEEIKTNKKLPYDQYSLDAALKDCTEYFQDGTLIGVLLKVNQ